MADIKNSKVGFFARTIQRVRPVFANNAFPMFRYIDRMDRAEPNGYGIEFSGSGGMCCDMVICHSARRNCWDAFCLPVFKEFCQFCSTTPSHARRKW